MRYTVTAALPYTNGPIHIGHLAGVYIPADIFVRYLRQKGEDAIYICGSDEHGAAIPMKAQKEGKSPQEIIDKYHRVIKESFKKFGIDFDNYSRTSAQVHRQTAQNFFKKLYENGIFKEIDSEQLYDPEANQFLADRFVVGICPKCGYEEAYGDQCESCGSAMSPTDLINPKSTISGANPKWKNTKHWYLPLNDFEDFFKEWVLKRHKEDWKPNVYGQVKSWIDDGLRERAVTRDLDWGIPVPLKGAEEKVLYVWFDAPIGYISSTKEWANREGKDWKPYWKDKDTKLIHFIGKDNIVFHCLIFPAMLKAHGDYILPDNVPANEFLNLEGKKLSTSKNWAVWLDEYLEDFPEKQDVLRYVLTAITPESKDSDFTWKDFQQRNNSELVGIFGNFFHRTTVLTHKYYDGMVPKPFGLSKSDEDTLEKIKTFSDEIGKSIESYHFREAIQQLMGVARLGNKYLADEAPWKIIKTDPDRVSTTMYISLQIAAALTVLSKPFLPFTSTKMERILALGVKPWNAVKAGDLLEIGHKIDKTELLFDKIEDTTVQVQIDKLRHTEKTVNPGDSKVLPQKETVRYYDFQKMDIRIGTIVNAEKMPKANKLLILKVDTGIDRRTIVSGIAEHYKPEDIVGKQVLVLVNLASRKLRGVQSEGMVLMTESSDNRLVFVSPQDDVPNGKTVI